jgi:hypothetical protein
MNDMNMELPICPACEGDLEYTDFVLDDCDGDVVWFNCHGHCVECGKEYHWFERYCFSGITAIECTGEREV